MSHSKIKFVPLRATIAVLALSLASPLWAMDDMGGGMGNAAPMKKDDSMRMQPKNSMPAQQPASSMQDPMATPAKLGEPAAGKQPAGALAPNPAAADSAPSAMPGMSAPMPHR